MESQYKQGEREREREGGVNLLLYLVRIIPLSPFPLLPSCTYTGHRPAHPEGGDEGAVWLP